MLRSRRARVVEFLILFVALPAVLASGIAPVHPILLANVVALFCLAAVLFDPGFDRRRLWNATALRTSDLLAPCALGASLLALVVALWAPDRLFWLPRHRPGFWLFLLAAYPFLSVYPQEVIYRAFFFHRYRTLFGDGWAMVAASAAAFGYMHILFGNWIAVVLTLAGGTIFAWRYQRTGSLLASCVEHALYGQWIFTVGLGEYFTKGTQRLLG